MMSLQQHHRHCNHDDTLRKRRSDSISYQQSAFDPTSNQQMTLYMNRVPVVSPTLHYQHRTRTVAGATSHFSSAPKMDKTSGTGSPLAPLFPAESSGTRISTCNTQLLLQQRFHHHSQQPQAQLYCRPQPQQAVVLKGLRCNLPFQQQQQKQQPLNPEVGCQYHSKDDERNSTSTRGRSVSICSWSSSSQQQQSSKETLLFSSTSLKQCFEQENHDVGNTNEEEVVGCDYPISTRKLHTSADDSIIPLQATAESSYHDTSQQDVPTEENGSKGSFKKYDLSKEYYSVHEHEILIAAEILCTIKAENIKKITDNTRGRENQKDYTRDTNVDGLSITTSSSASTNASTNNGEAQQPSSVIFQDLTKPTPKSAMVLSSKGELSPKRKRSQFVSVRNNNGDFFVPSKFSKKKCNNKQRRISKQEIYDSIINNESYHKRGITGNTTAIPHEKVPRDYYDDDCNDYNVHYPQKCLRNEEKRKKKNAVVPNKRGKNNKKRKRRKSLPNRLALPNDPLEVNSLHCYVRSELLELFVVPDVSKQESSSMSFSRSTTCNSRTSSMKHHGLGKYKKHDSSSDDCDNVDLDDEEYVPSSGSRTRTCNNNRRSSRDHQSKSVCTSADSSTTTTIITTSTFRRNIPGRVGLRCLFCKPHEEDRKKHKKQSCTTTTSSSSSSVATKADFYPKSIQMLYREVCTWQRVHFQHCQHVPQECREKYRYLKESDKSRGKTKYWETSAREMGLVDVFGADGDYDGICFKDNM